MRTTSLTPNTAKPIKLPKRNDDRIILHFDYDCFYASVFENEEPSLKSQPLGIKQKSILATCNYVARARGVKKLMLISEAQKLCPDLILRNGEDLTRFRDVSKRLWTFLRAHSWSNRVERLGLDEVFLDVTDIVAYNRDVLNVHALGASFFQLDRDDPVKGFAFDGSKFSGCVQPDDDGKGGLVDVEDPLCVRLMLASHLAGYLRHKIDVDFGYTSSGGISTNKLLAKLAGSVNKPNNQTTLLAQGSDGSDAVAAFMDAHSIRKVPGIGSRIAQLIEEHLLSRPAELRDREGDNLRVGSARRYPGMSPELLEKILDRPGAERGSGEKIWGLLHGVDPSEVKEASDVPTQISIEDTYMSRPLQTPADLSRELHALATSLIRRMRVDLTEADIRPTGQNDDTASSSPWLAYPKTLRLSTRTKPRQFIPSSSTSNNTGTDGAEAPSFSQIASRLVTESLLPLFRRLHPSRGGGWNLALINVCVTNMVLVARDDSNSGSGSGSTSSFAAGRNIGRMFRTQEDKLREFTVYDTSSPFPVRGTTTNPLPPPPITAAIPFPRNHSSNREGDPGGDVETEREGMAGSGGYDAEIENFGTVGKGEDVEKEQGKGDEDEMQFQMQNATDTHGINTPLVDKTQNCGNDEEAWYEDDEDGGDTWDEEQTVSDSHRCQICGHAVPVFAISAHERFHSMNE